MERAQPTDEEVARLIAELQSLRNGEQTVALLIECGERAIAPLREFLLHGRPSGVYEPRRWAVEALAGLGARHVLVEYLFAPKEIADPVSRFGEEAVESAAARELAAWRSETVFHMLLELAGQHLRIGLIEALGEFRRKEAIPIFDRALEDDYYRPAAEQALRLLGEEAREALLLSAATPLPNTVAESTSSLRRRRSALGLLTELKAGPEGISILHPVVESSDPELVVGAARLMAPFVSPEDRAWLARRLLDVLLAAGWFLQEDIENCLVLLGVEARSLLDAEVARWIAMPEEERAALGAYQVLERASRRLHGSAPLH
ncbi:MAG TPA: hypothetical protein VG672_06885 [Bryobacteraceae bacterium]|jgi:hypothetical protein|nr:hypothetical protein [Bryobacteraceae bacterium]